MAGGNAQEQQDISDTKNFSMLYTRVVTEEMINLKSDQSRYPVRRDLDD